MMMTLSSLFERPLLIYDDKCYSCIKLASAVSMLSRGWIRTAGHYRSEEAAKAKAVVFPKDFDSMGMSWLIDRHGAHGAGSAIPPLVREIIVGWFKGGNKSDSFELACEYADRSCYTPTNFLKRLAMTLSHGMTFRF